MAPQQDPVKVPFGPPSSPRLFTWEEIWLRTKKGDPQRELWLVIDRKVYDIRSFLQRHPGGTRILCSHVGENVTLTLLATEEGLTQGSTLLWRLLPLASSSTLPAYYLWQEAFTAFHGNKSLVTKFLNSLLIGELAPDQPSFEPSKNKLLIEDFRELQATVEKMGLLKPNASFFFFIFFHILALEAAAWFTLVYFGTSLLPFMVSLVLTTISQVQAKWFQHDLGHLSVFKKTKWNHLLHAFTLGHLLGASARWWTAMHSQHHAKPNCYSKDPDIDMHPYLFTFGKSLSVELGKKKIKYMPYNHQHKYFSFTLPPLLIPIIFQWHTIHVSVKKGYWLDLAWIFSFFLRITLVYGSLLGIKSFLLFYFLFRILESSWFVWVSQMNHIPMNIDYDKQLDWFSSQLQATCNVDQSLFNDWFTGHLNFQIEHHLFPRMPRHNYSKVTPLVKSLCAKHGIEYKCKPLLTAFADILHSLKDSGELWMDAYLNK